jgi:flagellin-specific chaperone FliS
MYKTSGVQSYQQIGVESAVMNASPHQLIVMLFDGAHSALVARVCSWKPDKFVRKAKRYRKPSISSTTV